MAETVAEWVLAAHEYVRRAVGLELDGSVESLAYVDHYIAKVGEVSDEVLALVAPALGAYFGEVVLTRVGGHWQTGGDPAAWRVVLDPVAVSFAPAAMAAEALRHADVAGYDASLAVPREVESVLMQALESAVPVEEDYYYSLTGRFENIEHVVEMLVELKRRKLEDEGDKPA